MNSPLYVMDWGWAFGCTQLGTSHKRRNAPNQDSWRVQTGSRHDGSIVLMAVADGHGDARHDLSHFGSNLAVHAAVTEMRSFYQSYGKAQDPFALRANFKAHFPRKTLQRWHGTVIDDATNRPDIPEPRSDNLRRLFSRYGTTLMTALITPDTILISQIGDGDVVVVREDGSLEIPFTPDPTLVGVATYSLALPDAARRWQTTAIARNGQDLLMLATDGLSNAFANDREFHKFCGSLVDRLKTYGVDKVAGAIPSWLEMYSSQASGDDITLTFFYFK